MSITKQVSGKVIDENGHPINGASVTVKNFRQGVATDSTGKFTLNLESAFTQVVISAVGVETQEVDFEKDNFKLITLRSNALLKGKVLIAGAVSTINKSQLIRNPAIKAFCAKTIITNLKLKIFPKTVSPDQKLTLNTFSIFPNPIISNSKLNIKWKDNISSDQSIEIYNQTGNLLQQEVIRINKKTNQQSIDLKQLPAGTYVIKKDPNA